MEEARWSADGLPPTLGAVVHGPLVVARSPGIVLAVRHVVAHPTGLELDVVIHAEGVQAEAAGRQSGLSRTGSIPPDDVAHWSEPVIEVWVDDHLGQVHPGSSSSEHGEGDRDHHYACNFALWVPAVPSDGRIGVRGRWPEAGLAPGEVVLELGDLSDLATRVVRLL